MLERLSTRTRITLLVTGCSLPAFFLALYAREGAVMALPYTLLGLGAVSVLMVSLAWVGAERLVLDPINVMLAMTRRVRAGDLGARTGMKPTHEELSQLGSALDDMARQLENRQRELQQALVSLTEQAMTDPLTGLYNRRFLWDALTREIAAARRKRVPFSVILFDLDRFKRVNDAFGHDAGDIVIKEVAAVLKASVRGSDIAVRHGGEEFAVLLPETSVDVAAERAERLRQELEQHEIRYGDDKLHITASFGVAENPPGASDAGALMRTVDAAMYSAKAAGRNRLVVSRSWLPAVEGDVAECVLSAGSRAISPASLER